MDFGLAEVCTPRSPNRKNTDNRQREGTDASYCMCQSASRRDVRQVVATGARTESVGYPKNDTR